MKKLGLLFIAVEIIVLVIIGYQTAHVPDRPQIEAIQLQQPPSNLFNQDFNVSPASDAAAPISLKRANQPQTEPTYDKSFQTSLLMKSGTQ